MLKFLNKGGKNEGEGLYSPPIRVKVSLSMWTSWFKQNILVKDRSKKVRKDVEDMPPQKKKKDFL